MYNKLTLKYSHLWNLVLNILFCKYLEKLSEVAQFLILLHNLLRKKSMEGLIATTG